MPRYLNRFAVPDHYEYDILSEDGTKLGTIRVKPSSVLWKPKGQQKFYRVPLNKFTDWITAEETGATRTKS